MRKAIAFFISGALCFSMLAVSPKAAFAADDSTVLASESSGYALFSGITADKGTWNTEFVSEKYSYTLKLGEDEDSVTLTPEKADPAEIVKVKGKAIEENYIVSVDNGKYKYVKFTVSMEGKKSRTYTIKVKRDKSTNNDLKTLSVSNGVFDVEFDPSVLEYNVSVPFYTPYVTVKASKADSHSTLKISGYKVKSKRYWVDAGAENVKNVWVRVKSQTGVTKIYKLHITRDESEFTDKALALLDFAQFYIGTKYVRAGKGPDKFDCSGFVYYCLNGAVRSIRYMTSHVWPKSKFEKIKKLEDMVAGDILCFKGHVGIYMGDGMMIDAGSSVSGVSVRECTSNYWVTNFICGKRVIKYVPPEDGSDSKALLFNTGE